MRSCGAQINANEGSSGDGARGCASRQRLPPRGGCPARPGYGVQGGPVFPAVPAPRRVWEDGTDLRRGTESPQQLVEGNAQLWEWGVQRRGQCGEAGALPFAASRPPTAGPSHPPAPGPLQQPGAGSGEGHLWWGAGGRLRRGERAWRREGPTGLHHSCLSVQPRGLPPSREPPRASRDCPGGREERGPLGWLVFFSFSVFW